MRLTLAIETSNPGAADRGDGEIGAGSAEGTETKSGASVALGLVCTETLRVDVLAVEAVGEAKVMGSAATRRERKAGGEADDLLMPAIERLFTRSGRKVRELGCVAVSVGPGGYTGVRVACATGAMLAEAARTLQKKEGAAGSASPSDAHVTNHRLSPCVCVGVPSQVSAAMAYAMHERSGIGGQSVSTSTGNLAVALASKGDSVWVSAPMPLGMGDRPDLTEIAGRSGRVLREGGIAALREVGVSVLLADGFLPEAMRHACRAAGIDLKPIVFNAEGVLHASARLRGGDPTGLVPLYPREPDAVMLWRQRKTAP